MYLAPFLKLTFFSPSTLEISLCSWYPVTKLKISACIITAYLISHFIYNYPTGSGFANIVGKLFSEYHYTYQHISYFPLFLMVHTSPPWVTSSRLYPWRKLLHSWSLLKKRDLGYFNVTFPIYTDWNRGGNLIQGQKLLGLAFEIAVL